MEMGEANGFKVCLESENPMFADRLDIKGERENQNNLYYIMQNLSPQWSTAVSMETTSHNGNNLGKYLRLSLRYLLIISSTWRTCAVRGTNKRNLGAFKEFEFY